MKYGYARVSTKSQRLDRQLTTLTKLGCDKIYAEKYTGTSADRTEWRKLLRIVQSGDTVIFDSVSRMSRNAENGIKDYFELYGKGINLEFVKEPSINTDTYRNALKSINHTESNCGDNATDDLINSIMSAIESYQMALATEQIRRAFEQADKEASDTRKRVSEGLCESKRNNIEHGLKSGDSGYKQIGRAKGNCFATKKSVQAKDIIRKYSSAFGGTLPDCECMKLCGIARNSFYKYKREMMQNEN